LRTRTAFASLSPKKNDSSTQGTSTTSSVAVLRPLPNDLNYWTPGAVRKVTQS
jgi:hypothetical protein